MSGHSKWSTIKHKKGKEDARRGQLFSKLSRAITVAAKEGGGDPAANATLLNAIEKARGYSMPKDNIERAIQRGAGGGEGATSSTSSTRATARPAWPSSSRCSRTTATARPPTSATSSPSTTAAWRSRARWPGSSSAAAPIMVDAEKYDEDDVMRWPRRRRRRHRPRRHRRSRSLTEPTAFVAVRDGLRRPASPDSAELTLMPKTTVVLDEADARRTLRLVDALEENDDVQEVYANFDIPEEILQAVAD